MRISDWSSDVCSSDLITVSTTTTAPPSGSRASISAISIPSAIASIRRPERNSMSVARICFDVGSFYYLPQYLPVYDDLRARGVACSFVFSDDPIYGELLRSEERRGGTECVSTCR